MEIIYCNEEDISEIMGEIGREANEKKLKINVIPQFVGAVHTVFNFGLYDTSHQNFKTIILRPNPRPHPYPHPYPHPQSDPANVQYIQAQGQDVSVSSQAHVSEKVPG